MRATTIAIITVILIALTVPATIIAIEYGTQSNTVTLDGKTYVNTTEGLQESKDVEYMRGTVINIASPMPITVNPENTPVMLPSTSAPHGTVTCTLVDSKGYIYTVTRETCNDL